MRHRGHRQQCQLSALHGAYPPSLPEGMRPQLCRNAQQGRGCCGGENEPAV